MNKRKCKICGKQCSSGVILEPDERIPEVKKTLFFCSERCLNVFVASIKRERRRSANKSIRSSLETAEHEPSKDETFQILMTLTAKEKSILSAIAVGTLLAQYRTCKEFYEKLHEIMRK